MAAGSGSCQQPVEAAPAAAQPSIGTSLDLRHDAPGGIESASRGGGRDRPAQPGTRRAVGAETERLRRAERPAERGRLRRGCFGMAAAKAGAGSCDADASEMAAAKAHAGCCLRVLHIVANE